MTEHSSWTVPPGLRISDGSGGAQKPLVVGGTPAVGDTLVYDGTNFVPTAASGAALMSIVRHATNATLNTTTDVGALHVVSADGVVLTLPALADGLRYTVLDRSAAHNAALQPQAGDVVAYQGSSSAAGAPLHNGFYGNSMVEVVGIAGVGWVTTGENGSNGWST